MRVFVGEYLCGGGMVSTPLEQIPPSLLREGRAMWQALVTDFAAWADVLTPLDARLENLANVLPRDVQRLTVNASANVAEAWLEAAQTCDVAIVVAPETDGELHRMITVFRESGVEVLAVDQTLVRMATDKWLTAQWLAKHKIATPVTWAQKCQLSDDAAREMDGWGSVGLDAKRWVRKPRDGCGSESVRVFDDRVSADSGSQSNDIVQAWIEGRPASILIVGAMTDGGMTKGRNQPVICPAMWQDCEWCVDDLAFPSQPAGSGARYRGGSGPIESDLQSRGRALADQVLRAMPEPPRGFLGIDFILGDRPEEDCVIEINPRLTTSYIGVRELVRGNLTSIWESCRSPETAISKRSFEWSSDPVCWTAEGEVHPQTLR
ncbi:protein containing ATP-grasp domain protein [Rhodopirellula islandica]|uniref:Protein containing ATP-grasp domain protein n=1 Tax=Rhodopirellula islandica TaxID=595434 RepID=A0A0J1BJH7_RHOIS|nr:ATP-grasp domain-containing protein [Rhodopirellula islandica]KLU06573.1 protein containing ATP-grasp domain protein [Rhodopirellula islandica]